MSLKHVTLRQLELMLPLHILRPGQKRLPCANGLLKLLHNIVEYNCTVHTMAKYSH